MPGDYNRDGTVNAADYTVWRNTLGSTTDLRANGDNTYASANKIDARIIDWKQRHGTGVRAGSGGSAVSEPLAVTSAAATVETASESLAVPPTDARAAVPKVGAARSLTASSTRDAQLRDRLLESRLFTTR